MIIVKGQQNADYNNALGDQIVQTFQTIAQAGGNLYSTWRQPGETPQQTPPGGALPAVADTPDTPEEPKRILGMQPYLFYILMGVITLGAITAVVYYVRKSKNA